MDAAVRCLARGMLAACVLSAPAAGATTLYKSIGPNGVIQFSDTPPENGVVVEERAVPDARADGRPIFGTGPGGQALAFANPLQTVAEGIDEDEALARANAQVDLAEHALALARSSAWTRREGLRLHPPQRTRTDNERIAFYERNLRAARATLLALIGDRPHFSYRETLAPTRTASSVLTVSR